VNVLTIEALIFQTEGSSRAESIHGGRLGGNARKIGVDVECEGPKTLNVDAAASSKIIVQVLNKRLPNDDHLFEEVIRVCSLE
jgi:hypothetical protein